MNKRSVVLFAAGILAGICWAEGPYPVSSTVRETSAVAVRLHPVLYAETTSDRDAALAAELRVRDENDAVVPYALRPRLFRIDGLRVAERVATTTFEAAPAEELEIRAEVARDLAGKKTTLTFNTYGMPVTAVGIVTKEENFSRPMRVLVRRNNGWTPIATGQVRSLALPGKTERNLELVLGREVCEPVLQIELDDGDNPLLSFETLAVSCKVAPYDIVFIAKPGMHYLIGCEKGAERPRYDSVVLDYIREVKDPVRLDLVLPAEGVTWAFGDDGPTEVWLSWNPLPWVAGLVFAVLLVVCLCLLRSTGGKE